MCGRIAAFLILGIAIGVLLLNVSIAISGLPFGVSWTNGWNASTLVQYATTPTSTWKTLCVALPGDNICYAPDNNALTRGRYYYFRMRHIADNGAGLTPWSKPIGAVWLTGSVPEGGTYLTPKDNNAAIIKIPGGLP